MSARGVVPYELRYSEYELVMTMNEWGLGHDATRSRQISATEHAGTIMRDDHGRLMRQTPMIIPHDPGALRCADLPRALRVVPETSLVHDHHQLIFRVVFLQHAGAVSPEQTRVPEIGGVSLRACAASRGLGRNWRTIMCAPSAVMGVYMSILRRKEENQKRGVRMTCLLCFPDMCLHVWKSDCLRQSLAR